MTVETRLPTRVIGAALAIDLVCVVVFATLGRRSHAEGLTATGIASTAWPFLVGTLVGWLLVQAWRRPLALAPTGLVVWLATVVVGMVLRAVTSRGTAPSFIVVATLVTAALLLGWRGIAAVVTRRRARG